MCTIKVPIQEKAWKLFNDPRIKTTNTVLQKDVH